MCKAYSEFGKRKVSANILVKAVASVSPLLFPALCSFANVSVLASPEKAWEKVYYLFRYNPCQSRFNIR